MSGWWYTCIPTPLKKIWVRQLGLFFPICGKIKNGPNYQPIVLYYLHNPKDIICGLLKMVDPQVTMNVSMLKWSNLDDLGVPPFNLRKLHTCIHIYIYTYCINGLLCSISHDMCVYIYTYIHIYILYISIPWVISHNLHLHQLYLLPSSKLTVRPWTSPIFHGFTSLPTPMTARVELLIYQRVIWTIWFYGSMVMISYDG